jgi:CPA2 family monovalent cation:H+ antiporter-2
MGEKKPAYAGRLLSQDIHLTDYEVPGESAWAGRTLKELNLGRKYDVHVVSILRGMKRINIPGAEERIFPMDKIQVIGTDEQLNLFSREMESVSSLDNGAIENSTMVLKQFVVDADSIFRHHKLRDLGIREQYRCLVVGVERDGNSLMSPDVNAPFEEGDVVWVVGENDNVHQLVNQKNEKVDNK